MDSAMNPTTLPLLMLMKSQLKWQVKRAVKSNGKAPSHRGVKGNEHEQHSVKIGIKQ